MFSGGTESLHASRMTVKVFSTSSSGRTAKFSLSFASGKLLFWNLKNYEHRNCFRKLRAGYSFSIIVVKIVLGISEKFKFFEENLQSLLNIYQIFTKMFFFVYKKYENTLIQLEK